MNVILQSGRATIAQQHTETHEQVHGGSFSWPGLFSVQISLLELKEGNTMERSGGCLAPVRRGGELPEAS